MRWLNAAVMIGVAMSTGWAAMQIGGQYGKAPTQVSRAGMLWIPAEEFMMGTDDVESQSNERPARLVKVGGFWIDEHDVTNAQFRAFVTETHYVTTAERPVDWDELRKQVPPGTPRPPAEMLQPGSLVFTPTVKEVQLDDVRAWWRWTPGANWKHPQGPGSGIDGKDEYPVVQVSWDDAMAYARWAGKSLPTEAQWEYAARGGLKEKRFNWGNEFKPSGRAMANIYSGVFPVKDTAEDGYGGTSPWQAFPPNGYGLFDMAGNVWQWTADVYHESSGTAVCPACVAAITCDPLSSTEARRVIKGGSFLCSVQYCESYRPSARRGTPRDTGSEHVGFRCVINGEK